MDGRGGNLWLFGGQFGGSSFTPSNDLWKFSAGQWTWMSGSTQIDQPGVYGTQGTTASANLPGARTDANTWIDSAGNFWLFAGDGCDSIGCAGPLNDVWEYSGGQWTWVSGPNRFGQPPSYGTQGITARDNIPGSRLGATIWQDQSGNVWLFGGLGQDAAKADGGYLNDFWKYQR